jgi:hypothetical protein
VSNQTFKVFSADQHSISVAGILINSGWDDGEFVNIEQASDSFGDKAGADGEVVRWATLDRRATAKIKVMHTSDGNAELSALHNQDVNAPNGAGVGVFELRDLATGALLAHADHAWIQKPPVVARGREVTAQEWTIRIAHIVWNIQGAPTVA